MPEIMLFLVASAILVEVLAQFHQSDYNLTSERLEIAEYDSNYLTGKVHNYKFNRTAAAINMTLDMLVDFGFDLEAMVESYKLASNEYRSFPMDFKVNICDVIKRNDFGLQNFYSCGNLPRCPITKGRYTVCNWTPDAEHFPPYIPSGSYMTKTKWMFKHNQILVTQWYFKIEKKFHFV